MSTVDLNKDYLKSCSYLDEVPKDLRNCKCCVTHKIDFPRVGGILPKFNKNKCKIPKNCECPCRHIARNFCRKWDFINQVEDILEYESESYDSDSSGSLKDFIVEDVTSSKTRKNK